MRWYYSVGKRIWPHEVWNFLFREKRRRDGLTLNEFWGPPLDAEEAAMRCRLTVSKGARHIVNQAKSACSTIAPATKSLLPSSRCHRPRQSTHLPPKPPHRQIPIVPTANPAARGFLPGRLFGRRPSERARIVRPGRHPKPFTDADIPMERGLASFSPPAGQYRGSSSCSGRRDS